MQEFLPIEIEFLAEADALPEAYRNYFLPPLADPILIPAKDSHVGDMEIRVFRTFIFIKIGSHTELRVSPADEAVQYIRDVLTDQVVFYFGSGGVEYFKATEFENLSETDWDYYVWSGPFRYNFLHDAGNN